MLVPVREVSDLKLPSKQMLRNLPSTKMSGPQAKKWCHHSNGVISNQVSPGFGMASEFWAFPCK